MVGSGGPYENCEEYEGIKSAGGVVTQVPTEVTEAMEERLDGWEDGRL